MDDHRDIDQPPAPATNPGLPQAPDYEPGFPSGAERLGPAWNLIYWGIPDLLWVRADDVGTAYAERTGLHPHTIANMIRKAAAAGKLERRHVGRRGLVRWMYRRGPGTPR